MMIGQSERNKEQQHSNHIYLFHSSLAAAAGGAQLCCAFYLASAKYAKYGGREGGERSKAFLVS
jgi:hypothetical protein